jgi:hypothetical protein
MLSLTLCGSATASILRAVASTRCANASSVSRSSWQRFVVLRAPTDVRTLPASVELGVLSVVEREQVLEVLGSERFRRAHLIAQDMRNLSRDIAVHAAYIGPFMPQFVVQ